MITQKRITKATQITTQPPPTDGDALGSEPTDGDALGSDTRI